MATGRVPTTANSPLTAKGDLFGYSTAPARLAVGNNGESLVADSSTSTGLKYSGGNPVSNPFINSAFDIAQRGTSFTGITTGTTYTLDRWLIYMGAAASVSVSQQATGDTTNLPQIRYCGRVGRASGNTQTSAINLGQIFENSNSTRYVGQVYNLSFYARAGANFSSAGSALTAYVNYGTGTDQSFAGGVNSFTSISQAVTLTTTWQRFTAQVTGLSGLSATLAAAATQLCINFAYTPVGTAGANDYFEVTGVQIDLGSTALPFRRNGATLQGELAAAQRYYWRNTSGETLAAMSASMPAGSTTEVDHPVVFPVPMRVRPTSLDAGSLSTYDGTTNHTSGTYALIGSRSGTYFATVRYTHGSAALTQYRPYQIIANSSASAFIGFSAEL